MKEKLCTKFVGTYWAPYGREMVIFKRLLFFETLSLLLQLDSSRVIYFGTGNKYRKRKKRSLYVSTSTVKRLVRKSLDLPTSRTQVLFTSAKRER